MAHYGKFSGVTDYIALIGRKNDKLNEICGYCGEQLVLLAAQLGLDSCWVAMSYAKVKNAYTIAKGRSCAALSLSATERRTEHLIKANHPKKLR